MDQCGVAVLEKGTTLPCGPRLALVHGSCSKTKDMSGTECLHCQPIMQRGEY
jgi:hypothetical protein